MRLVDIIRQSSNDCDTLWRRGKSEYNSKVLLNKIDQPVHTKTQNEIFNKHIVRHWFYGKKKNNIGRLINSQTRILRSSQNDSITKKLYVQIRDLRDDIKASKTYISLLKTAQTIKLHWDDSESILHLNTSKDDNVFTEPNEKFTKFKITHDSLYSSHTRHQSGNKCLSDISKSLQKTIRDKRYSGNGNLEDSEVRNCIAST